MRRSTEPAMRPRVRPAVTLAVLGVAAMFGLATTAALGQSAVALPGVANPAIAPASSGASSGAAASRAPAAPGAKPWATIGRPATAAEIKAWDIDVRADFTGLPPGSGSVSKGQDIWDAQCASCHGTFGEATDVFAPIVGGTTQADIRTGRVANLARADYPQRTTLMKLSQLSTLWDYINRAMPWNAPKSLSVEEVYAVTAYILHLGDIVPADFTLSDRNIREVQNLLPNRNGMQVWDGLWDVRGKPDVTNVACMQNCDVEPQVRSTLPEHARDSHGNLALQDRLIGGTRGADTTQPASREPQRLALAALSGASASGASGAPGTPGTSVSVAATSPDKLPAELARNAACMSCHGLDKRIVGPSFREVSDRYKADAKSLDLLVGRVRNGSTGAWGPIPMPAQPQVAATEAASIVKWILDGAR
jgi:S-disulfanyl-L-cysteine oxidoreductase SoxD